MASVYNRGTRAKPNWYASYKDLDGKWKAAPTHKPLERQAQVVADEIQARVDAGQPALLRDEPTFGDLLEPWLKSLTNRNAPNDRSRSRLHLLPHFRNMRLAAIDLAAVLTWLDDLKAAEHSDELRRSCLALLSRFFSWAVVRGYAQLNPVQLIPRGERPKPTPKKEAPWLKDDATVRKVMAALREPVNLMFYLCNRSGLRLGESAGLRMGDLAWLKKGAIRVGHSYDGPLKEDKDGSGKVKWAPAPADAPKVLGPWIRRRRAEGAKPEDRLFPNRYRGEETCFNKKFVQRAMEEAKAILGKHGLDIEITFYQATRHSFTSRNLAGGASLDEVSAALGHSTPTITRRYYDHFVRKEFSPGLREGLGAGASKKPPRR